MSAGTPKSDGLDHFFRQVPAEVEATCLKCRKTSTDLRVCAGCKAFHYCDKY